MGKQASGGSEELKTEGHPAAQFFKELGYNIVPFYPQTWIATKELGSSKLTATEAKRIYAAVQVAIQQFADGLVEKAGWYPEVDPKEDTLVPVSTIQTAAKAVQEGA